MLTRDSIRTALKSGITADQIVGFLRMHAHPKMIKPSCPILPPTVVDQIYLWEQERNRFTFSEGVLYSQFMSQSDFETLRDYAQDLGVLVWQNERKRTMVRGKCLCFCKYTVCVAIFKNLKLKKKIRRYYYFFLIHLFIYFFFQVIDLLTF